MKKHFIEIILCSLILIVIFSCKNESEQPIELVKNDKDSSSTLIEAARDSVIFKVPVKAKITVANYFKYMDTLVARYNSLVKYTLTEHIIVRANPWIIDTLENTDYYRRKERREFVYNQKKLVVLKIGDYIIIPDSLWANEITQKQENTIIDVNIPEYKLKIIEAGEVIHTFLVRVGRNEIKYLETVGRDVDLRTQPGEGEIVRINKKPKFINPVDGEKYEFTRRDDGKKSLMPLIPWIEPKIDGHRFGHMIHPTTNPKTLGKAYSNGCVGTSEADAWRIYYYAPLGTKVNFRYDLAIENENGDTIQLKDIYKWKSSRRKTPPIAGLLFILNEENEMILVK